MPDTSQNTVVLPTLAYGIPNIPYATVFIRYRVWESAKKTNFCYITDFIRSR